MDVLVVDYQKTEGELLAKLLELSGFQPRTAWSPEALLAELDRARPEAILWRVRVATEKESFETSKALRQDPVLSQTLLVAAVNPMGRGVLPQNARAAGFDVAFETPLMIDDLRQVLAEHAVRIGRDRTHPIAQDLPADPD